MAFEWAPAKSRGNHRKHGFGFEEAKAVFADSQLYVEFDDREYGEDRWIAIGRLGKIIAVVIYTDRSGVLRLISARKASPDEETLYYAHWI